MKERTFFPLNNNVLLVSKPVGEVYESSGLITDIVSDVVTVPEAEVKAVANTINELEKGDTVAYTAQAAYNIVINGKRMIITNFDNILGKIK